ncbi:MAG: lipoate--protein ligase family protein [Candidatus Omnitrophica bacterium]|nr:lipoate--protein ligase family protein [Candidatus Omnitrophota bacterium]
MPPTWCQFDSGPCSPDFNMALDEALLVSSHLLRRPVLRFYAWSEPAASFGFFQRHAEVARWTRLRPLVRRPTGGGLVPHLADWTYSLVFPPDDPWYSIKALASYRQLHEWIQAAFADLGVATSLAPVPVPTAPGQCFVGAAQFDVLFEGRKIAGAAQRRTRDGLLIQGSVQCQPPSVNRADWQEAMSKVAQSRHGVEWTRFEPDAGLIELATELARQKFSQAAYNQRC